MDTAISAIIFDLGNVLIDFDHWIAAERVSKFTDKSPKQIYNIFFDSELTALFEEGRISSRDFFSRIKSLLNLRLDYESFVYIWNEIFFFTQKNLSVFNIASTLKDRYNVAILSNINILHFEYIRKTFPFLDTLKMLTSFELGARKPSPLIYQKALEIMDVSYASAFYTDDRAELVESARVLGIKSFVFKGIQGLKEDLESQGIKI